MNTLRHFASRLPLAALLLPLTLLVTSCSRPSLYKSNGAMSIVALLNYVVAIIVIIDVFKQPWGIVRKLIWTVVVLLPLGLILYYLVSGRTSQKTV
jgi:hypothetical protein